MIEPDLVMRVVTFLLGFFTGSVLILSIVLMKKEK